MGSTRLPGKVLLPLNGHTVIAEVLTRCKRIPGVNRVICAVPDGEWRLLEAASPYCDVIYGPEHDVLARYYHAAVAAKADIIRTAIREYLAHPRYTLASDPTA